MRCLVASKPLLIYFISLFFLRTSNWEASLLLSRTPRLGSPSSPCGCIHPVCCCCCCWVRFSFQGKPREPYTTVIHAAVLVVELHVLTPRCWIFNLLFIVVVTLLLHSGCPATLFKSGKQRAMSKKTFSSASSAPGLSFIPLCLLLWLYCQWNVGDSCWTEHERCTLPLELREPSSLRNLPWHPAAFDLIVCCFTAADVSCVRGILCPRVTEPLGLRLRQPLLQCLNPRGETGQWCLRFGPLLSRNCIRWSPRQSDSHFFIFANLRGNYYRLRRDIVLTQ